MIAILVLVIAMGCHKLATRRAFFTWQRDSMTSFLVPSLVLNLYLSSDGRYRVVGLSLCSVASLLGCYALFSMSHWGDGMSDASGEARRD